MSERLAGVAVLFAAASLVAPAAVANTEQDLPFIRQALQDALSAPAVGNETKWQNPQTGNFGGIRAGPLSQGSDGSDCRTYTRTWFFNSGLTTHQGRACQDNRGAWRVQQETHVSRVDNINVAAMPPAALPAHAPAPTPAVPTRPTVVAVAPAPAPRVQPPSAAPRPQPEQGASKASRGRPEVSGAGVAVAVAVVPGPTLGRMPYKTKLQ